MIVCVILDDFEVKIKKYTKERRNGMDRAVRRDVLAIDVAKHIIDFCSKQEEQVPVSNIKLQKLLYLVYGGYCLDNEEVLFGELFQAWQYGPVVASVYDEFCFFAGAHICLTDEPPALPECITTAIDPVIEKNMRREVFDLVEETHRPGSAWYKAVQQGGGVKNHPILSIEDIIEEFRERRDNHGISSAL